jgi:outer membrane protein
MRYFILGLLFPLAAWAQPPQEGDFSFDLGVGVIVNEEAYRDVDTEVRPIPLVDLRYKRFYIRGINFGYLLFTGDRNQLAVTLRPQFTDLEEEDSPFFEGMEDRELAAMLGFDWDIDLGNRFSLELNLEGDVTGRNEGSVASLNLSRVFIHKRKTIIIPEISLSYADESFNDYYYGVRLTEALPERPFYEADGGLNYEASIVFRHSFTPKVTFLTIVSAEFLADEITDSPLVAEDYTTTLVTGITWKIR